MSRDSGTAHRDHATYDVVLEVRWWDQDLLDHVNHVMIVSYLAEARTRWLGHHAVTEGVPDFRHPRVVVKLEVEYVRGVTAGRPLVVSMHVSRVGGGSYTVAYRGHQDGTTAFRASTVLVPTAGDGSTRKVTPAERAYLAQFSGSRSELSS
ncbi:acyl-CoA thioesterase [Micromonospora sp. NBC_01638]|uniref:acyl-CoA thioesterase n=1 Tax=Micromonospora sp. NBC_01638 TaxID=2975982 RepID=UPI00386687AB|nr:acyl-CoA thioesterase [Micromonospora sp. NBC_01638]